MDLFEAIRTTRSMRRLDPDKPVSEGDIWTIVEAATKGASGSNSQPVRWIVVTDATARRRLGEIYAKAWAVAAVRYAAEPEPEPERQRVINSAAHLGAHMGEASVIIIPASRGGNGASVYPGVQNLFLAARALGLGTTLTTMYRAHEDEVRELLGLPDDVVTWAMIPVGYPLGRWGKAKRLPVEETTYWDTWEQTRTRSS